MTMYYEVKISAEDQEQAVMKDVRKTTVEDVPMMTFTAPNDMSQELRDWIDQTLA